ncbi:HNH endonuclease family protein [Mycobacterium sp. M26]|uniref:HNH endonuclease family protein n=1 Tax=Mycobacterium sp. M26 TaxID=1762962 RepID=UPI00073F3D27|nr:HNH endonuclease family protein [Mycobacterium sp. M26]
MLAVLVVGAVLSLVLWDRHQAERRTSGPSPTWTATPSTSAPAPPPATGAATPRFDQARAQLAALPVKGWDRTQDFQRWRFGKAWSDDVNVEFGHNGCNTRDDILRRDLTNLVVRSGTCYAQTGVLHDPYTGTVIDFVRGPETSNTVEIDHVVSLADAWYKGARAWDPQRRLDFANDPRNLLAVSPKANFDKAFRDAASWLPPNEAFRCDFVARQVEVKAAYGLWLSAKEKQAMADVLARC